MNSSSKRRWKTVQLPEELLNRVDEMCAHREFGYTSRAEFIKEAVRLRVEAIENILRQRTGEKPTT